MTVRHLLPIVMVAEAPPRGGLGPLGMLDCDSGHRLARLDPANDRMREVDHNRIALANTLGLFERRNLLAEHPGRASRGDAWPKDQARDAWSRMLGELVGRRVALVGRALEAAGLRGLPPLTWARIGGACAPAEVCYLPHPSGVNRWYNVHTNRLAVADWFSEVRREREDANAAWVSLGGGWAYHLVWGIWGQHEGLKFRGRELVGTSYANVVRDLLLTAAARVPRFTGVGALSLLDHALLVADLCATPGAKRAALAHDLHEAPLVGDCSTPLKRIIEREWRPVERAAQAAVERLLGLQPTPEEREEVRRADRLALLVEARQVGVDLGDPDAEFGSLRACLARACARQSSRTDWLAAWGACAR